MVEILIKNSKSEKWVEKEIQELNDTGITNLGDMLKYWLNHFKNAKYPVDKFIIFKNNFVNTIEKLGY